MDPKEAPPHPASQPFAGSSSFTSENNEFLSDTSTVLNYDNVDSSGSGIKSPVFEDDDYLSGDEEFVMALDNPVLDEAAGEDVRDENLDSSSEDESVSGANLGGGDSVGEGGNVVIEKAEMNGDRSEEDRSGLLLPSEPQEKVVSEVVIEEAEKDGGEEGESGLLSTGDELNEPQEKVVPEVPVEKVGEDSEEGGSEFLSDENELNEPQEKVVSVVQGESRSFVPDESGEPEEKVVSEVPISESEEPQSGGTDDVNLMAPEDSVVDTIQVQVDVIHPGVAVVGETEENGHMINRSEDKDIPDVAVVEYAGDTFTSGDNGDDEGDRGEVVKLKALQPEDFVAAVEEDEILDTGDDGGLANGGGILDRDNNLKKLEVDYESTLIPGASKNDTEGNTDADGIQINGEYSGNNVHSSGLGDGVPEEIKRAMSAEPEADPKEIREVEGDEDGVHLEDSMSDGGADGIFGDSKASEDLIEQLERESSGGLHTGADRSLQLSQRVDGQIVTDSEEEGEEGDTDDDGGEEKELFDSSALAALLRAATGADNGSNGYITSQDGSRLFSVERPAGLGSSLQSLRPASRPNRTNLFNIPTPAGGGGSEENLSEEERKKLEKLQQIKVKFLRLVHRLGLSPDEPVAAQVLYKLALLGGRHGHQTFGLDDAKNTALQLEEQGNDDLDFSVKLLVIGKSGVGKSATINSLFGEEKVSTDAFNTGTVSVKPISGIINGVKVHVIDTPGLKTSVVEQGFNRHVLSSVKKLTKKSPLDVVLYVDRLDTQSRDLNDLPFLKTVTSALGSPIWRNAIVTLTHGASAPPDGSSGVPLSYEVYVSQRSHVVQQAIGHAVGDLRMMSPSLMNPVCFVENHPSCRKNREGQKILPNGQSWRPQLLLLCYSLKILSEASSVAKQQDPFDPRKLFGFRGRSPPLGYMMLPVLQSRQHPKLPSDQGGGDNIDSDIDLDDLSDSDQEEEEDEYDQLPPFKPLKKAQIAKLDRDQKRAYFEEYDYRVKLLQKKQWKDELKRMREVKRRGKDAALDYGNAEEDADAGAAAPVAVPLPDMALPASFDGDNPAYRYRFLEPVSTFLARPVLDGNGWDHDCGYDGVNVEHTLAIASRFPVAYTIQITKDKKDFNISLDSSVSAKHGEKVSTMAGFDIQAVGKQLAYVLRAETKFKNLKKHKAGGGASVTFLGENVIPGVKIEDEITLGKQYSLVGSAGALRSQHDTAYGANFEVQRREIGYPIGQVQSSVSMSVIKWAGGLSLGLNGSTQLSVGRNSKVLVRGGINNRKSGQITVRTSSSEHLSLALAAVIPTFLSIYRKVWPGVGENYSIY